MNGIVIVYSVSMAGSLMGIKSIRSTSNILNSDGSIQNRFRWDCLTANGAVNMIEFDKNFGTVQGRQMDILHYAQKLIVGIML